MVKWIRSSGASGMVLRSQLVSWLIAGMLILAFVVPSVLSRHRLAKHCPEILPGRANASISGQAGRMGIASNRTRFFRRLSLETLLRPLPSSGFGGTEDRF